MVNTRVHRATAGIDRAAALALEEQFFERLAATVGATQGLYNPMDDRTYDAASRNRVTRVSDDRSAEVKTLVKKLAERDLMRTYEEMPKGGVVLHEILHRELLGRASVRIAIAGAPFSPTDELITSGTSRRRATAEELNRVKDAIVRNPNVFYYVGAFSTTGWEEGVRRGLVGPNHLIALVDVHEDAWRTYWAPDPRWRSAARVFDLTSEEEKIQAIRRWVKRHTFELLMDELTEDTVFNELGYAIPIIRAAFQSIAEGDPYVRFDAATRPCRLVRTYG